jgi:[histone H3]-trimethyl-L-lysine4 demethylase
MRVILPFEHFCERVRNSPALSPQKVGNEPLRTASAARVTRNSSPLKPKSDRRVGASPPGSPLTSTSSPLTEEDPDDDRNMDVDVLPSLGGPASSERVKQAKNGEVRSSHNLGDATSLNFSTSEPAEL